MVDVVRVGDRRIDPLDQPLDIALRLEGIDDVRDLLDLVQRAGFMAVFNL